MKTDKDKAKEEAADVNAAKEQAEPIKAGQGDELSDAALDEVAGGRSINPTGEWHRKPIDKL